MQAQLGVDRASISRVHSASGEFEIIATSGARLLVTGTRLPVGTSSHFQAAAEQRPFVAPSFLAFPGFDRPLDQVVLAAGFRSGCTVPLMRGAEVVGAIALSSESEGPQVERAATSLTAVGGMLAVALDRQAEPVAPVVLVCHDDPLAAHGMARLVEASAAARTHVCLTLDEAVASIRTEPPDVIVCDGFLRGVRVDELGGALRRAGAGAPLLVVATHDTPENLGAAVSAGAAAYIARAHALDALPLALATLRDGRTLLPDDAGVTMGSERLTEREREMLASLDEGLRMKQIAVRHGISEATAKSHARNVFRKLGATSRAEAVREARRQGMLV